MPKTRLRARLDRLAECEPFLDILLRLQAVAKDPDGEAIWLLLAPKSEAPDTIH